MPLPRFNYLLPLVLLHVSLLPMLPPALGAYLSASNQTMTASMPAYPISFSNTTFFLDRVPLYVISKTETANSCEVKDFPNQWPFVVLVHEQTTCGDFQKMLNLCDRKGCLGVIYAHLLNPSMAGWISHIAGSRKITSSTPAMTMEAFPGPQLDWLMREGASRPGAVLISVGPDEYNEGAIVLSSWKFRSIGIIFALHAFANIVAVLWKLLEKILSLRDKIQPKPRIPFSHTSIRCRFGLPTIAIWHPLFVLIPELMNGMVFSTFWINILFFRAQGLAWNLFRVILTATFSLTFISTFSTAFIFSRITLQNKYSKQRSLAHKLASSSYLRTLLWVVVLADIALAIHTAITDVELFPGSLITEFYTIMQLVGSIYFIVGGHKMVKLLSKGASFSEFQQSQTLQFANRMWYIGVFMLGYMTAIAIVALSVTIFQSATAFWYSFALSAPFGLSVNSAQIQAIVVRRKDRRIRDSDGSKIEAKV